MIKSAKKQGVQVPHLQNKVGDVYEILLSMGRKAYAQYVYEDRSYGSLISVFDLVTTEEASLPNILKSPTKFPPVFCNVVAVLRKGLIKSIGHATVNQFDHPGFVLWKDDIRGRKPAAWFLWDGNQFYKLGAVVPQKFRGMEVLRSWTLQEIVERIETGRLPFDCLQKERREASVDGNKL